MGYDMNVADCQLVMHESFSTRYGFLKSFSVDSTFGCVVIQQQRGIKCHKLTTYHRLAPDIEPTSTQSIDGHRMGLR